MLDTDLYKENLKDSAFGHVLLDWAKSMIPKEEKDVLLRDRGWTGSLLNYYLRDVAEIYQDIKVADISKITFNEYSIRVLRVSGYEFAPLSRAPFLVILYGMMRADKCEPHHNMTKKAGKLMSFIEDYHPKEAEMLRTIVLYNDTKVPDGAWTEEMIMEEAEAHLHPTIQKRFVEQMHNQQVNITVKGDLKIDKNYGTLIDNHDGGKIVHRNKSNT